MYVLRSIVKNGGCNRSVDPCAVTILRSVCEKEEIKRKKRSGHYHFLNFASEKRCFNVFYNVHQNQVFDKAPHLIEQDKPFNGRDYNNLCILLFQIIRFRSFLD